MRIKYKCLPILVLLATLIWSCKKEEIRSVDPMVSGINIQALKAAATLNAGDWNAALIGLRDQRIKLFGVKKLIAGGQYNDDKYTLKDPALATKQADETLAIIDFKMDSLWKANIKNDFDAINVNSAGIKNFGLPAYNAASVKLVAIYAFLKAEIKDDTKPVYAPNDLVDFKAEIAVLTGLSALNESDVIKFVSDIKAKLALMKQQYADLAAPVASSPFFSNAQKAVYAKIKQPLIDIETVINTNLSLAAKDKLDAIDRDLSALIYFVANNYTSPAQKPIVFGQISSITELRWLGEVATVQEKTNNWTLTVDIDAAETKRWNPTAKRPGFQQIVKLNGTFDGQNHIINGIYMTNSGTRPGFFDDIFGAIKGLGLTNLYIKSISGASGQGGGLFGLISNANVTNCFVHGTIERNNQSGGFGGRTAGTVNLENCFSAVNTPAGVGDVSNSASFLGLPTGTLSLKNCYITGANPTRVIFGYPAGLVLSAASGIFYDPATVGTTALDRGAGGYGASPTKIYDAGIVTALPTAQWNSLANFAGFTSTTWEIKTVTEIDANPRPYLKGFNYGAIKDFVKP